FIDLPSSVIKFYIIGIFIINLSCQIVEAIDARWGHASTLIDNTLYVYGGNVGATQKVGRKTNQLLLLDMKKSFPITNPSWIISNDDGPKVAYHAISFGGENNRILVLYGGESPDTSPPANSLFYYDTVNKSWSSPAIAVASRRIEHTIQTRVNDSMVYVFGGAPAIDPDVTSQVQYQDLYYLDSIKNIWSTTNLQLNTPFGRFHHTATLLSDGKMYVIGGYSGNSLVDMSDIYVFDTIMSQWNRTVAGGTIPTPRREHVAAGTDDGRIIIHGGVDINFTILYDDIAVLDTTQTPITWINVTVQGKSPPGRYAHSANIAGSNMMIIFGYMANELGDNNIYVLDTKSYKWLDTYTPNLPPTPTESATAPPNKTGIVVGASIAGVFVGSLIFGLMFYFYRKRKNHDYVGSHYAAQTSNPIPPQMNPSGNNSHGNLAPNPVHDKDYSENLEKQMMGIDVQHTNMVIVPKSKLYVVNPDNSSD
ncbi:21834_t:CDS:2, partial [Entrophospora sp. SA101]